MNLIVFNFESDKNSQVLAFALDWINEIAKNVNKIYVVSLRCGEFEVADNVEIHCINQNQKSRIQTVLSIWKVVAHIHKKDNNISGYFVHMAHYFVPIIYPFAKYYNTKTVLWYAHKSVPFSLKLAGLLSDKIFSISLASMRLKTNKFESIGHGIDTQNRFKLLEQFRNKIKNIVTVGRISESKNTKLIVDSFLNINRNDLYLYVVGDSVTIEDKEYLEKIKSHIPEEFKTNIIFTGSIPFTELPHTYKDMDLAINISDTGSLDKAIIEPMAMGIPTITSNDSAKELFGSLNEEGIFLLDEKNNLEKLLKRVINDNKNFNRTNLRNEVVEKHSLNKLAIKILHEFK